MEEKVNDMSINLEQKMEEKVNDMSINLEQPDLLPSSQNKGAKKFRKMYIAALAALLNGVNMGFGSSYTATALNDMKRPDSIIHPTQDEEGWIGSLVAIGALFGGLIAGNLSQSTGRRGAQLISSLPMVIGWLFIIFATSVPYLYVGRIFIGLGCGIVSGATPMYIVEIATPDVRGLLGSAFQLFVMVGVLSASCFGSFLHWNHLAIVGCALTVIAFICIIFVKESPRWLMSKGKESAAKDAIEWFQSGFVDASELCTSIKKDIDNQPQGTITPKDFLEPDAYKPAFLAISLMFFQQFSGVNVIIFYTVDIFQKAGSTLSGTLATIIVVGVGLLSNLLSCLISDKAGRKLLLLISGVFMSLSLGIFGGFEFAASTNTDVRTTFGWLPVACLIVFVAAFSIGYGPIAWMMVGELTNARLRSVTSGVATALNWIFAFIVTKTFFDLENAIHSYGAYWFYTAINVSSCLFSILLLPETKGKTFEEIQKSFQRKLSLRRLSLRRLSSVKKQSHTVN